MDDVIGVRIEHHGGGSTAVLLRRGPPQRTSRSSTPRAPRTASRPSAGGLTARVCDARRRGSVEFVADGRVLTSSTRPPVGVVTDAAGRHYVHEQLTLGVGRARLRPGRAVRPVREERPDGRHLERGRRHVQRAGVQERAVLPLRRAATACSSTTPAGSRSRSAPRRCRAPSSACRASRCEYYVIHGPTPKDVLAPLHRADRPPGAVAGLVVRPVALHLVHHAATTRRRSRRSSTAWPSATCR